MANNVFPDLSSAFGKRVRRRLREETTIWLTTVGADGTPQPNPVWFVADGDTVLIYNRSDAHRLAHIRRNPRVTLHFDGDGHGGNIVVLSGRAEILDEEPSAHEVSSYLDKYESSMVRVGGDLESFRAEYPIAVRVTVDRVRGF